jgi:sulfite reductase (NADPH) hemoprotein beta-component
LARRRDNKYKARIKILVKALTPAVFAEKVEAEFAHTVKTLKIDAETLQKMDEPVSCGIFLFQGHGRSDL